MNEKKLQIEDLELPVEETNSERADGAQGAGSSPAESPTLKSSQ